MERRVARREDATFTDAEQTDLVYAVTFADRVDAIRQITVDVVIECEPAVGTRGIAPIYDVEIDAEFEKFRTSDRSSCRSAIV